MIDARHHRMLERASRAPSGHNAQPWSVRLHSATHWTVGRDDARRLPAIDPDDRELTLSLGAFIEALVIAGAAEGLAVEANGTELSLGPMTADATRLDALALRRTVRGPFEERPLDASDVAALSEEGGVRYFAPGTGPYRRITEATIEANRAQALRDDAQRELIEWIRWTKKDAEARRDGLSLAALGIDGLTVWVAEHFLSKQRLLSKSARESQGDDAAKVIRHSAGWLVVEGSDLLETGRRLLRTWLRARARNVAIQPMSQALEERPWRGELGDAQLFLRVGYVKRYPPPVSLRRAVDSFVVG